MTQPHIIFHYPLPIVEGGASGGQMRPAHMLHAFQELGYHVEVVAGYAAERQSAIQRIQRLAAAGQKFAFTYAETINKPLLLAERLHLNEPEYTNRDYIHTLSKQGLWLDIQFFRWLKQMAIPLGLFCRDIYWQFEFYQKQMSWLRQLFHRPLYLYDWQQFKQTASHLFVPDLAMCEVLPGRWDKATVSALPPGSVIQETKTEQRANSPLKLFYVGGIVPPRYDLKAGFDALANLNNLSLTVCCRPSEWQAWQSYYQIAEHINIVHAQGMALQQHYQTADLFFMVREPFDYWQYTIPIKIFEALGYGVPIIILQGTPAAEFVKMHEIGWVIDHVNELPQLLTQLEQDRTQIAQKREQMLRIREEHSWLNRAKTAAEKLIK